MIFKIKNMAGKTLFEVDADSFKTALEAATKKKINLRGAALRGAALRGADISGADISRADLSRANIRGAKTNFGVLSVPPISIIGLVYSVFITEHHIQIGCESHPTNDWQEFGDEKIASMDGKTALCFWKENRALILPLADRLQQKAIGKAT